MSKGLRIGYSFWGFLGDHKMDVNGFSVSTPDGNATYSWSIVWEALRRGHSVWSMQMDRDVPAYERMGPSLFDAFSSDKRRAAYVGLNRTNGMTLPDLDVLLVEWRFPIPGRNTAADRMNVDFQQDLDRQNELLRHYHGTTTSVVVWDLDHKLLDEDVVDLERLGGPFTSIETSVKPRGRSIRVEPPTVVDDIMQFDTSPVDHHRAAVYVGSRYERDSEIDYWIGPLSERFPGRVKFYGKWDDDARRRWRDVDFGRRITTVDFRSTYGPAGCCPLLAKPSYRDTGFMTPRIWEALMFGTLPVGLGGHLGIEQYTPYVAGSPDGLCTLVDDLSAMGTIERHRAREELAHRLRFMDAGNFVNVLEGTVG